MYNVSLIRNVFLSFTCKEQYNISELEEEMNVKAYEEYSNGELFSIFQYHYFILTEEQALYFKTKYDHFIRSIEEIEEDGDDV